MYRFLRNTHLLCGLFALPALLMYGVSAVQMAHSKWFRMKPAVTETRVSLPPGASDGRTVALQAMAARGFSGEIREIRATPSGWDIQIVVPGTVHEISYDRSTGSSSIKTSVAGFLGMLNRLHHAGGLWPEYAPLRYWGVLAGLVSLVTLVLGVTGVWMWWLRRQERFWGVLLLIANLAFSLAILVSLRAAGGF